MTTVLLLVLLALKAHAAVEVCDGSIYGGVKTLGLTYDHYCEVTSDNLIRAWPAGSVSSARKCESIATDSNDTKWYNSRSDGSCELLSYCENLLVEVNSVTGPDPGAGESCFTQEVLLVIGGVTTTSGITGSVDVVTESLTILTGSIPDVPVTVSGSAAGLIGDQVVVCAGLGTTCQHLNVTTGTWDDTTNMATPRPDAAATVHDGVFYMIGGIDGGSLDTVEGFYPSLNTWCDIPEWTLPEANRAFCAIQHGIYIYIIGGFGIADSSVVRRLNTSSGNYETLPSMFVPRYGHACLVTSINGEAGILVTGGTNGFPLTLLSSTEFFSFDSQKWLALEDMNSARYLHGMEELSGRPVVLGGLSGAVALDTIETYSASDHEWVTETGVLLTGRSKV